MSSYAVEVTNISHSYGKKKVIHDLTLKVKEGEFVSLLGPSGCGKTTTLNLIAGFENNDKGEISLLGEKVSKQPPYKRNIGVVFQSYALFPHMTVFENVAFGLQMRKVPKSEISKRVPEALATVQLKGMEDRLPNQLSGGQQQRVAMARALVIRPALLLLDEPLSNLDAKLRDEMRIELKEIQKKVGITTIFVTHDQDEALAISDRIAVMNNGMIEQIGTPEDIYEEPSTEFVQRFIGSTNAITGHIVDQKDNEIGIQISDNTVIWGINKDKSSSSQNATIFVRPERITIIPTDGSVNDDIEEHTCGENTLIGKVVFHAYQGATTLYKIQTKAGDLIVREPTPRNESPIIIGTKVKIAWMIADTRCRIANLEENEA